MKKARPTTKADETTEFLAFWECWKPIMHKNDGRGSARDEFFRHVEERGADPQDIVDGARWFVRNGGNAEYKLHAQTWLNRRAYEDGAESERAYQASLIERSENVIQIKPAKKTAFLEQWERERGQA